ncbi:MAG: UDP-glucose 4-epimerase GalE [Oceanococcus sp.]
MKVLVLGGAGYIGSHMVRYLRERGETVCVFDNLSTGHAWAVPEGLLRQGDLLNATAISAVVSEFAPDVVMHFAAKSIIPESVSDPHRYYQTNLSGTMNLLAAMREHGVDKLIFSSTAAVYGTPDSTPITESATTRPISPYGRTKLFMEQMITDYAAAYDFKTISLRYFNAAGAHPDGDIGEAHEPETHLIPNILKSMVNGDFKLQLFGTEHPTVDGTCVRDYIHVMDLAAAHYQAALHLPQLAAGGSEVFNLGVGNGYSVLEVLQAAEKVVGRSIPRDVRPARAGDPPELVADASRAEQSLDWQCNYSDLDTILQTAWKWHS